VNDPPGPHLLVVPQWYPSASNPALGAFVRDQVHAVSGRYRVTVLVHDPYLGGEPVRSGVEDGLRVVRVQTRADPVSSRGRLAFLLRADRVVRSMEADTDPPAVVHAHVFSAGFIALRLSRGRYPVLVSEHHSDFLEGKVRGRSALVARSVFRGADLVCPVSERLRGALESFEPRGRYEVVPNVVDVEAFTGPRQDLSDPEGAARVLVVAMLGPQKGIDYLLRALVDLPQRDRALTVDIVGDGPVRPELERLAARLLPTGMVTFHGERPREEVSALMARSDFLVLPSIVETFGVVVLEALAAGLPIITTAAVPGSEHVDGRFGVVVPAADVSALRQAVQSMLERAWSYGREEPAEILEEFSPRAVGARWDAIYRSLERPRASAPAKSLV
jgi:glycosyltransferase involved in cell wall biosynthesis